MSEEYRRCYAGNPSGAWYQWQMTLFTYTLQRYNLMHEDRTSSAQGVEARVPFLDRELVEFLASIPPSRHASLFWNKRIVREMATRWLPQWAVERPKVPLYSVRARSSIQRIMFQIVKIAYPEFRSAYLSHADRMFVPNELDEVYAAAMRDVSNAGARALLLSCMSFGIFDRLTRFNSVSAANRAVLPPSPLEAIQSLSLLSWA
jgi:asparagine synthase (glutamine-hydrolysing)